MELGVMLGLMGQGMLKTCAIFILTLIGSVPLGMIVCKLRKSQFAPVRYVTKFYISLMRGTPLMLQLLVWYFAPHFMFGMSIATWRFPALVVGFVMNYAAYFAEIYRGGVESMPIGQYEAAEILGYSKFQTFYKIIMPQVAKRVLPAMTNEAITLVKDTSLAFTLAYQELFSVTRQIVAGGTSMIPFAVAALFYYVANYVVAFVMEKIEKKLDYYK